MKAAIVVGSFVVLLALAAPAFAAHPLITDDAGTQGKGKAQLEFTGEYGHDAEDGVITNSFIAPLTPVLSYGIADGADLVLGIPVERIETRQAGEATVQRGLSDVSLQAKWRFYEKDGLGFAVKPGVALPTGNENKGLGNGELSYSAFFITTKDAAPWAFHFNVGYIRNEYKLQADEDASRKDIWHLSAASQVKLLENLTLVANTGMERNPDKQSNRHPAFLLGGIIYSIADGIDLDLGIKAGLTGPEADRTFLAGLTWKL